MAEPGIEIPFNVEADGAEVTIEKLAAAVLELQSSMDKLNQTASKTKTAVQFTALLQGVTLVKDAFKAATGFARDFSAEMEQASAFGSKFQNLSLQYNTSAEALQKLAAAGKPFGVSTEQIARSLSLVERSMSKMGPVFKKYGIDQREVAGKDAADRFTFLAAKIGAIKNPTEQAAASFALLKDRSGAFLKLIRDPSGVQGAISDFEKFGLAVNNNAVGALDKLGNQRDLIRDIFEALKRNILGAVAASPALQTAIRIIAELLGSLSKFVKDNQKTITEWVNTAIVVAADALVFVAKSVIPPLIDGLTVLALGIQGVITAFKIVAATAKLAFDIATAPTNAAKAWEDYKKSVESAVDSGIEGVGKIVDANIALQNKAAEAANGMAKLRDRIAEAAKNGEDFSAPIKAAGEAAGLSAEEIAELTKATEAWEEKMREVARTTAAGFTELAEKDLPAIEQQINAVGRAAVEQARKLEEEFAKTNKARALEGKPLLDRASLDKNLTEIATLARDKVTRLRDDFAKSIGDAADKTLQATRESIFGNFDEIEDKARELGNALRAHLGKGFEDALEAADFATLHPENLDAAIKKLEEMRNAAIRAGESVTKLEADLKAARTAALQQAGDRTVQGDILKRQASDLRQQETLTKTQLATRRDIVKEMLKAKEITKDEAEKLLPQAVKNSELFRDALRVAADAAEILGSNDLSNLVGGVLSAAAAAEGLAKAFREAATTSEKLKAGLAAGAAGLGVAGNILKGSQTQNQGKAVASGAAQGAAFGSQFGVPGAIVGGIAGGLIGFFGSSRFKKIAKDAGRTLGTELSDETVKKIQEDAKRLNLSIANASLLNITTAIEDSKKAASTFGPQIQNLIKGIADKSIPAKEGLEQLAQAFGLVAKEALDAGRVGDRALVGIIKQARASGVESPEIKAFVSEQLSKATEGFNKFAALFKKQTQEQIDKLSEGGAEAFASLSDDAVKKLAADTGTIFGAVFNSLVSEQGITKAVDQMKASFDTLKERLTETLGQDAVNQILGPFGAAFDTLSNEKLRPIFEGIDGLSQAMQGLANAGFLTTEQFTAMQKATSTLFDEAIAGGADMKTALTAVAPSIQAAISAAEQFGVPLDEDTQRLKDLAEQNGITFKTDPQRAMLDVLVAIADVMGAKIPDSVNKMRNSIVSDTGAAANAVSQDFDTMSRKASEFSGTTSDAVLRAGEQTTEVFNSTTEAVITSLDEIAARGSETWQTLQDGSVTLADSIATDIPEAAEVALESLQALQDAAAQEIRIGGGGVTGGVAGQRGPVNANITVNVPINENPLAAADTAAAMRQQTVQWAAEAIEDRVPVIVAALEGA